MKFSLDNMSMSKSDELPCDHIILADQITLVCNHLCFPRTKLTLITHLTGRGHSGGYSINYWVGMCRWDSETLSLY